MTTAERKNGANVLWFLPTHGDGRYLGSNEGARTVDLDYLAQIAQAADNLGYYGVLLPTGKSCEDAWVVASAMVPLTKNLRFLVAVRPGLQPPSLAARMTATLDRLSGGRTLVNVVTGGDPVENKGDGIHLDHAERYEVTREFLEVYKRLLAGEKVDHRGDHMNVEGAELIFPPLQEDGPPLWFGGSSPDAIGVAARTIDKYLTWGEPPEQVAEKVATVREAAYQAGREVSFGIRLHVIVRPSGEEAWAAADELIANLDDETIASAQKIFARMDSEGQRRMSALHGGRRDKPAVTPNLGPGVGRARAGAGTALVGDPETVAERMREYMDAGIDSFILSGYPHLEEAYRFAELVMPRLPLAHGGPRLQARGANTGPFGETIANDHRPPASTRPRTTSR